MGDAVFFYVPNIIGELFTAQKKRIVQLLVYSISCTVGKVATRHACDSWCALFRIATLLFILLLALLFGSSELGPRNEYTANMSCVYLYCFRG